MEAIQHHPVFDVCEMYSKANMYNLGSGIYPKAKIPPLPAHPHCLRIPIACAAAQPSMPAKST